jgi:glycosyltransferase involved in cell wall biosynthesis
LFVVTALNPGGAERQVVDLAGKLQARKWTVSVASMIESQGLLTGIAGYLARVPFRVYTMRGLRLETASGVKRQVLIWAERLACAVADRVVCNSHSLRQKAIDLGLVRAEKACVFGKGSRGIDQARFAPTPERILQGATLRATWGIPPSAPVIGFAGRLVRDKGIVELVAAYQQLKVALPDVRLLLLGNYETGDPIPGLTRRIIAEDPHILCPGHIRDIADYYQVMDVLALPTYREGFPSVVLEAQAAAKPVVTTFATGAVDSVVDGVTGLLVPAGDVSALAAAIESILRDKTYATRLGKAGRERALREFRHDAIWGSLVQEYYQLIGSGSPAPPLLRCLSDSLTIDTENTSHIHPVA